MFIVTFDILRGIAYLSGFPSTSSTSGMLSPALTILNVEAWKFLDVM